MKSIILILFFIMFFISCGDKPETTEHNPDGEGEEPTVTLNPEEPPNLSEAKQKELAEKEAALREQAKRAEQEGTAVTVGICGRTYIVQVVLLRQFPSKACEDVTEQDLASIVRFNLTGAGIESLKSGDFSGLVNVEWLSLISNKLKTLPSGLFDQLSKLEYLYLNGNDLESLPAHLLDHLADLIDFRLSNNKMSALPTGFFDHQSRLMIIGLNNNRFKTLPPGFFDTLITNLNANGNELVFLALGGNLFDEAEKERITAELSGRMREEYFHYLLKDFEQSEE